MGMEGYGYIACWNSMLERTMIDILDRIKFARTAHFVKNHALGIAGPAVLQLSWQQQSHDRIMSAL